VVVSRAILALDSLRILALRTLNPLGVKSSYL
jgi:hypothetical protein